MVTVAESNHLVARRFSMSDKSKPVDIRFTSVISNDEDEDELFEDHAPIAKSESTASDVDSPITRTHPFRPQVRPAAARLRIYHDDQSSFETISLRSDRTVIGRSSGDITIEHDPQISSEHVEITRQMNQDRWEWHLRDLDSTNGTFVSVERARLHDGDELLMGSQRYRFVLEGEMARLQQIVNTGFSDSMELQREGTLVGRDKSEQMSCFHDPFLDPKHALIQLGRDEQWFVANTKSLNGVWYRVRELRLFRACYFQIGEQRIGFRS